MSALPLDSLPPTQPPVLPRVGHDQEETKDARGVHLAATPSPSIWETAEVTFQIDRRTITLPQFIGDYKVLRLLGVGGMGVVVVVQNQFFGREEALKMIHDRLDSEKAHDDFIREMHAQAGMDHSHIAKVNYAGVCKQEGLCRNRLYLVMPLEAGDLAAQLTANGPFPPAAAANLVRRLAKAVAHAHDRNVIHCDLKPKNILLGKDGTPKITDFGLAKYLTKAGDRGGGGPYGTPSYMPPEQARGDAATCRSDVYGLGGILYELLTGKPPYTGEHRDSILMRVRADDIHPEHLRDADRRIPPRLKAICQKCLAKNPDDRYATAAELEDALDRAVRRYWLVRHWWTVLVAFVVLTLAAWGVSERVEKYAAPRDAFRAAVRTADEATDPTEKVAHYKDAVKHLDELLKQSAVVRWAFWKGEQETAAKALQELEVEKARADREAAWGATRSAADSLDRDARDLRERGDRGSAIKKYQEAAKKFAECVETDPRGTASDRRLGLTCQRAGALAQAGHLLGLERNPDDAHKALDDAADTIRPHAAAPAADLKLAEVHHYRGEVETVFENWANAERHYRAGLEIRKKWEKVREDDRELKLALARSHGYLADAQRNNGKAEDAERSYHEAKRLRGAVAESRPADIEAACFHARDYRNFADFYDWSNNLTGALQNHREALQYYRAQVSTRLRGLPPDMPWGGLWDAPLPGEFQSERADSELNAAELLLDMLPTTKSDLAEADLAAAAGHVAAARFEFAGLWSRHGRPDLQSSLVRVCLAEARLALATDRYHHRSDERARAAAAVREAERLLGELEQNEKVRLVSSEHYFQAVVLALRAELADTPAVRSRLLVLALDRLETVKRKGYQNWYRLKRDVAFNVLRRDPVHGPAFADIPPREAAPPHPESPNKP